LNKSNKFRKDSLDFSKPLFELEDPITRLQRIEILTFGAAKYPFGKDKLRNWRNVGRKDLHHYNGALHRHINAMDRGEFIDLESGLPHACHAQVNLDFLEWFRRVYGWKTVPEATYT
jgi:hypothetical protein